MGVFLCSVGEEVFGTAESDVDIGANVMRIHLLLDAAGHQLMMHVVIDTGEDDGDALLMAALDEHGEVVHCRRIDERYLTHTDDADGVFLARDMRHDVIKAVRDAEEIRAVDLIYLHAVGDGEVLQVELDVRIFIRVYLIM